MRAKWSVDLNGTVWKVSTTELRQLADRGAITAQTLIRNGDSSDSPWVAAGKVKGLAELIGPKKHGDATPGSENIERESSLDRPASGRVKRSPAPGSPRKTFVAVVIAVLLTAPATAAVMLATYKAPPAKILVRTVEKPSPVSNAQLTQLRQEMRKTVAAFDDLLSFIRKQLDDETIRAEALWSKRSMALDAEYEADELARETIGAAERVLRLDEDARMEYRFALRKLDNRAPLTPSELMILVDVGGVTIPLGTYRETMEIHLPPQLLKKFDEAVRAREVAAKQWQTAVGADEEAAKKSYEGVTLFSTAISDNLMPNVDKLTSAIEEIDAALR